MSIVVTATQAPNPKSQASRQIALAYAAFLTAMALAQLFTLERFLSLFSSFHLPLDAGLVTALPAVLVALEVAALPFLLRMWLSPAFRVVSMGAGWLVAFLWTGIALWVVLTRQAPDTIGFLGTAVPLIPGTWAVCVGAMMGLAAAWASWGMWPFGTHQKK